MISTVLSDLRKAFELGEHDIFLYEFKIYKFTDEHFFYLT